MRRLLPVALLVLTGCAPAMTGSTYTDGVFWFSNVKSASDVAGGPRQDIVIVVDRYGRVVNQYQASGPGVLQSLVGSLAPAVATGAGQAMAGYLQRPARNTTNVDMQVMGTGGSGGAGGSNANTNTNSATGTIFSGPGP